MAISGIVARGRDSDRDVGASQVPELAIPVMAAVYAAMVFTRRRAPVYENGVQLPADSPGARSRSITWQQVERLRQEGDILTMIATSSVIAGADLGGLRF